MKLDAVVLGCSFDPPEEQRAFADKYDFPFSLLPDTTRAIGLAYGAAESSDDQNARRIAYLIDPEGQVAEAHARVDAKKYPAQQLASIAKLRG